MKQFAASKRIRRGVLVAIAAAGLLTFTHQIAGQERPFEMLVVGDSHISGQGVSEKNRFYTLVHTWLQDDVFRSSRKVNLKVKAHSGARITLHPEEAELMRKNGDDPNKAYEMEANLSSPSLRAQIDSAHSEYEDPRLVELVVLSGCITDVLVAYTINPFSSSKKLRERTRRFCNKSMLELLDHTTKTFPNANVIVVGYFPIASINSDMNDFVRYFGRIIDWPDRMQFVFTNPMSKLFVRLLRKMVTNRSRLWLQESNRELRAAATLANQRLARPRIHFVEGPIKEENAFATKNPLLWGVGQDSLPNDETYERRKSICSKVFAGVKYHHYGRLTVRMCELSSVAHPNVEGSKAYAKAITDTLRSSFMTEQWANR